MDRATQHMDLIEEAVEALRVHARLRIRHALHERKDKDQDFDAELGLEWNGQLQTYWVEVKPNVNDVVIGRVTQQFRRVQHQALLIARHVPPPQATKLRDLGIQFLDTAGNAFLNAPGAYLFLHGNKPLRANAGKAQKGIFTPAGTKVIYTLLCNPDLVNAAYREIARAADVGLETISRVLKGLQRQAFLADTGTQGRRLLNTAQLFERWIIAYAEQLRPKQLIGTYRAGKAIDWANLDVPHHNALWGGETAAAKLTSYLKPAITTIYLRRPVKELVIEYKLVAHPEGDVELRELFWDFPYETAVPGIVPPLLIYADLMAHPDPRNVETAKLIYDEHLERHLRDH
ncbi:MAG TPA: type IV toxin-antitoxin system AbiEi family antitoxin [bacterium]|jgi:hypothetical protein